jgi:hypothetical protein
MSEISIRVKFIPGIKGNWDFRFVALCAIKLSLPSAILVRREETVTA